MPLPPPICCTQMSGCGPPAAERYASNLPSDEIVGLKDTPLKVSRVSARCAFLAGLECHQSQPAATATRNTNMLRPRASHLGLRFLAVDGASANVPESDSSFSSSKATFRSAMV